MLKNKILNFINGEGDNKKKIENLIFLLIILIITVVAINLIWKDESSNLDKSTEGNNMKLVTAIEEDSKENYSLEENLENILSNINGVGKVKVLITYNETEEIIPVYNKSDRKSVTNETDSEGGIRTVEESDSNQEIAYQEDKIVTQKTISPQIEGAIITATGAGDSNVKTNIILAVEAATGVPTHKIQVFEMKE